jgi:two-component system response regulator FlrC
MRIMIIGKLQGHIGTASKIAMQKGAQVTHVDDQEKALATLRSGKGADMILIDVALNISSLVNSLEQERINIPVVACGIGTDSEPAVRAIKSGAKEYMPLPPNADLIAAILEAVCEEEKSVECKDPVMQSVLKLASQVAPSDASILITGESGTGKEVMARFIHNNSRRKRNPFISINCAAIPESLLESELFGHEKGAFTGAIARRIGKFEEASGGTLLLDEVTEMQPLLQAKLLRAIQEKEIDRVGGSKPVKVDIRIIATSNRNMEQAVKEGTFREDLYFRLNVISIAMPALRERPLDIEPLAEYFIDKYSHANDISIEPISRQCRNILRQFLWRGNIRELENTMHRAVLLSDNGLITPQVLEVAGLSGALKTDPEPQSIKNTLIGRTVADVEKDLIIGTLSHCLGNRTKAATILGISIRTLRNKLKTYSENNNVESNYDEAI